MGSGASELAINGGTDGMSWSTAPATPRLRLPTERNRVGVRH